MPSNMQRIAAAEADLAIKDRLAKEPNASLEERFSIAMKVTRNHWCCQEENEQFRAAIEGLYISATDEEKERILDEAEMIRDFGALLSGAPIDIERMHQAENPIGLMKLWRGGESDG